MSSIEREKIDLKRVETLLAERKVLVAPEDNRNPVIIAVGLGIIDLVEVERTESGYFNGADQSKMINHGRVVLPIAFGQVVMQAVLPEVIS